MKISPKFMKNADPQDVVIVLGVFVLIISIIVFLHWAAVWEDQMSEREAQYKIQLKKHCCGALKR